MKYIISEERLKELLIKELKLEELYAGGVNNWEWYGAGDDLFLIDCVNGRVPEEEIPDDIDEEFIVNLDLKDYEKCFEK